MSAGFKMVKVAEYSTIPFALRGARSMSVIMAFCGSFGSSSPKKRPVRLSYGCFAFARGARCSTVTLVTSPVAAADAAANAQTANERVRMGLAMRQMLPEERLRAARLRVQASGTLVD